jgi:tetraacyldisaccharide 4'-kinase
MERRLTQLWYRPRGGPSLLQPLAWAYGAGMRARSCAYGLGWLRVEPSAKPVVVVGNVTVGGTGKTPLTVWLAEKLRDGGLRPGIVARGYGRREACADPRLVRADSRWEEVGDEPLLLSRRTGCPTVVAADRVAAARRLASESIDVILSDDGLQHLRLARVCEIAVIDGARGFGNGRLLPAGPLREPASRLDRVDLVVLNGSADHASLAPAALSRPVLRMSLIAARARRVDGSPAERPIEDFRGVPVHAVAGIGNPERFFRELEARGLELSRSAFPDHHPFTARDLAFCDDRPILMTEKDAVRCAALATARMWYVPVSARFDAVDAQALVGEVRRRVDAFRPRTR